MLAHPRAACTATRPSALPGALLASPAPVVIPRAGRCSGHRGPCGQPRPAHGRRSGHLLCGLGWGEGRLSGSPGKHWGMGTHPSTRTRPAAHPHPQGRSARQPAARRQAPLRSKQPKAQAASRWRPAGTSGGGELHRRLRQESEVRRAPALDAQTQPGPAPGAGAAPRVRVGLDVRYGRPADSPAPGHPTLTRARWSRPRALSPGQRPADQRRQAGPILTAPAKCSVWSTDRPRGSAPEAPNATKRAPQSLQIPGGGEEAGAPVIWAPGGGPHP